MDWFHPEEFYVEGAITLILYSRLTVLPNANVCLTTIAWLELMVSELLWSVNGIYDM